MLCTFAAYVAYAIRLRGVREAYRDAFVAIHLHDRRRRSRVVVLAGALRRRLRPTKSPRSKATFRRGVKFTPDAFYLALERYDDLTRQAAAERPKLIVWPETVIPVSLNRVPWLQARFAALAKTTGAELVVGTLQQRDDGDYNALYFFRSDGGLDAVYRKRQLVPFAEHLPFEHALSWIPWAKNISHFSSGEGNGVVSVHGMRFGPVVCWESAFSGLVVNDVRDGADALIIATDDAWFGTTAGPYQHAQIAQMRAIETGSWVVRAASTGISGLIAPTGRYTRRSELNRMTIVTGTIGAPAPTVYAALGAAPIPVRARTDLSRRAFRRFAPAPGSQRMMIRGTDAPANLTGSRRSDWGFGLRSPSGFPGAKICRRRRTVHRPCSRAARRWASASIRNPGPAATTRS